MAVNENISQFLFNYVNNPDPRYAVLLKGEWGVGKSFFIHNWIKKYSDKEYVLAPIYVSLYGLAKTSEITNSIDRVIHPFLYSKPAQFAKKLLSFAGKVVLKTDLDLNKDNEKDDLTLSTTIDSLALLASKESNKDLGTKLLIFDDLERCSIEPYHLLGYINSFVEHGSCHVIIIGDETHIEKEKDLYKIKEKTIGREFEIMPDLESAVDSFLEADIPIAEWVTRQKSFIIDCFNATKSKNLRILRQALYDFGVLYNEIDSILLEASELHMRTLLGSYIVIYTEYKSGERELLKNFKQNHINALIGNSDVQNKIQKLQVKYESLFRNYGIHVLQEEIIAKVVRTIETGISLKEYVENDLRQIKGKVQIQDKLAEFRILSNKEFTQAYNELRDNIYSCNISNPYLLGRSIALFIYFDLKEIRPITKKLIRFIKKAIRDYCESADSKDKLNKGRHSFISGIKSFIDSSSSALSLDLVNSFIKLFDKKESELKNVLELTLLSLSDDTIDSLIEFTELSEYDLSPIFTNIDHERVVNKILSLSNSALLKLSNFFSYHYKLGLNFNDSGSIYGDDLPALEYICQKLKDESERRKLVDKYVIIQLIECVDRVINSIKETNM
jgi:hypothetical protein